MRLLDLLRKSTEYLEAAGIDDALPEAEMLVFHVVNMNRLDAYVENPEITSADSIKVRRLLQRRLKGEPIQYIIGYIEFLGLIIRVGKGVLIPRPETELLVEEVIKTVKGEKLSNNYLEGNVSLQLRIATSHKIPPNLPFPKGGTFPSLEKRGEGRFLGNEISATEGIRKNTSCCTPHAFPTILDLCTGSGCIALSLAREFPDAEVHGTDLSKEALAYARNNAKANNIKNICFIQGSLFEPVKGKTFDIITANPPYIRRDDIETLQTEIRHWEPHTALDGGADGMDLYRAILGSAGSYLNPGGFIFLELGYDQAEGVQGIAREEGFREITVINDYAGLGRILKANT